MKRQLRICRMQGCAGQSTLEFAVLVGVVMAALIAMNIYMKRGMSGKLRESTEQIGDQYDPGTASSDFREVSSSVTTETSANTGLVSTGLDFVEQSRSGTETLSGNLLNRSLFE